MELLDWLNKYSGGLAVIWGVFLAMAGFAKWVLPPLLNNFPRKKGGKRKQALVVTWKWALVSGTVGLVLGIGGVFWCFNWGPCKPPFPREHLPQNPSRDELPPPSESRPPVPTGPSIAVLPFNNRTGDPKQEFFSDGFTETLITRLAQLTEIFVIDPFSSFAYKGKSEDIKKVARNLGVRHILIGSVERVSERIRISVQLVDGKTGKTIWVETFNREIKDISKIKDEIVTNITLKSQTKFLNK